MRIKTKQFSWKMIVTIWYTGFVFLITIFSMLSISRYAAETFSATHEGELEESLEDFMEDLDIVDGKIYTGEDGYYEDDIVFSIYNTEGRILGGYVPKYFPEDTVLKDEKSQVIEFEDLQWRTFDQKIELEGEGYWIRAIMYETRSVAMERTMLMIELSVLPLLLLLTAIGGYFITRRAFAPVEEIRQTAENIANGGNIGERVPERRAKGELQRLAKTFNGMLDTIESTLEEEKQFTADASHELRTPIAVILAESEYGAMDDVTEEERKEALEVVLEQGKKMSLLISQLLNMSRNENSRRNVQYEKVNISKVAETVSGELKSKAKDRGIEIITEVQPDLYVFAEQMGLTRIFVNLIENAIQYGKENGSIRVELKMILDRIQVKIADDGVGIKPEHLPNIFKRFYRADKARTAGNEVHAGLGLSMVQILVKNYGGKIEVESVYGEGTTFTLHFPLYENSKIR